MLHARCRSGVFVRRTCALWLLREARAYRAVCVNRAPYPSAARRHTPEHWCIRSRRAGAAAAATTAAAAARCTVSANTQTIRLLSLLHVSTDPYGNVPCFVAIAMCAHVLYAHTRSDAAPKPKSAFGWIDAANSTHKIRLPGVPGLAASKDARIASLHQPRTANHTLRTGTAEVYVCRISGWRRRCCCACRRWCRCARAVHRSTRTQHGRQPNGGTFSSHSSLVCARTSNRTAVFFLYPLPVLLCVTIVNESGALPIDISRVDIHTQYAISRVFSCCFLGTESD